MSEAMDFTSFKLPPVLVSRADIARLIREVETVDGDLESQKVKSEEPKLPVLSRSLQDFIALNKVDLINNHQRTLFKENLVKLKDSAPVVHMTFAVDADSETLQTLVAWLRQNAHPQSLLTVGLQPSLIGGAYIRTPNHVIDLSMRTLLEGKREVMRTILETGGKA